MTRHICARPDAPEPDPVVVDVHPGIASAVTRVAAQLDYAFPDATVSAGPDGCLRVTVLVPRP